MSEKTALRAALALNLAMVVLEIISAAMSWRQLGVWMFQFDHAGTATSSPSPPVRCPPRFSCAR